MAMNSSERNDFDAAVNGTWKEATPIPDDQVRWGSFPILREDNLARLRTLCEEQGKASKIGALYHTVLQVPSTVSPVATDLLASVVTEVTDVSSYFACAGRLFTHGIGSLFHMCKSSDDKDPNMNVPHIAQGKLGLPDKSNYTDKVDIHPQYKVFITDLCATYGYIVDASALLEFEVRKAELHLTRVQCRDSEATYNKTEWSVVHSWCPEFFDALGLPDNMSFAIVQNPALMAGLRALALATPVDTLRDHLLFCVARKLARLQTQQAFDLDFDFYEGVLRGQKTQKERWQTALNMVEDLIGDELGKLYVATHFPEDKRATCMAMIDDLVAAMRVTLDGVTWMAPETKVAAYQKLDAFGRKIGYPTKWHDYTGLWEDDNSTKDLTELSLEWGQWDWMTQEVPKFYTPVDRDLWHMTPQTVNAYYSPNMNEIVFPAGILQLPFFGYATYEENAGGIGGVIGHEMTHGYDDEGGKYNPSGELKEWWTPEDRVKFDALAHTVEEHYSGLTFCGKPVNGKLTLGENIADIGGLKLALRAVKLHYGEAGMDSQPGGRVGVYDRFFRSWATVWRLSSREAFSHQMLVVDPHAPAVLRINAALAHIPEFVETYGVVEGDGMWLAPEKRMAIW